MRRITFEPGPSDWPSPPTGLLTAYQFQGLSVHPEVVHAVFTRHGGVSGSPFASLNLSRSVGDDAAAVAENNRRMLAALGYRREQAVTAWLVHGGEAAVVGRSDRGRDPRRVDALVTRERGLPLTMRFADCVPIVLYDPQRHAIGVAHAGWRGVVANVTGATVRAMADAFGTDPRRLWAGIGPAISAEKYEVGRDVADQVAAACPPGARLMQPGSNGRPHVDLSAAIVAQLQAAGVREIETSGLCTASHTDEWFSHRAEQGRTGRFGLAVALADHD